MVTEARRYKGEHVAGIPSRVIDLLDTSAPETWTTDAIAGRINADVLNVQRAMHRLKDRGLVRIAGTTRHQSHNGVVNLWQSALTAAVPLRRCMACREPFEPKKNTRTKTCSKKCAQDLNEHGRVGGQDVVLDAASPWEPTDWMNDAACAGEDPNLFFAKQSLPKSKQAEAEDRAASICAACPVTSQCVSFAVRNGYDDGRWGLPPAERKNLRNGQAA